jgi:fluoroacetyl-CoA thioesterase
MISRMQKGLSSTIEFVVADQDTAEVLGSGDLPVLGTPRLLAWMEAATCASIAGSLPFGQTSVGTRVSIEHRAACAVGAHVSALATLTHVDGRLLKFEVVATDNHTRVVLGHGEITRVVVDRERFLARVTG